MSSKTPLEMPEYWFIFQNDQLLLFNMQDELKLPTHHLSSQLRPLFIRQHFLGLFNEMNCYSAEIDKSISLPDDIIPLPLRKAFERFGTDWYTAIAKAFSIVNWDKNHQYCGRCGHTTSYKPGTFERLCNVCGLSLYPRISPSIIVLIKKGDKILMSRSPHFPPGAYGLIAGFVEVGESIEDAVHREVKEEVNIEIKNLRYFGSQFWPFPDSLMLGFTADYASGEIHIDHNEIESADWYSHDNLPGRPSNISIAKKLIDAFLLEKRQK
jgi:NAD+ diphosphatase